MDNNLNLRLTLSFVDELSVIYFIDESEHLTIINIPSYSGEYNNLIKHYFDLIDGQLVSAVARIRMKEFSAFLKLKGIELQFYTKEHYEILSIGELIYKDYKKSDGPNSFSGNFFTLSYSEQLDWLEEFLSEHIYLDKHFSNVEFDFEVEDGHIYIETNIELPSHKEYVTSALSDYFSIHPGMVSFR